MRTIEIKYKKGYLIFYLALSLFAVFASAYFLFFTETFPEPTTKIAGAIANLIVLYGVSWRLFNQLRTNATGLLITSKKIGFYDKKNWNELTLSSIETYSFKEFYDGYTRRRQLILELATGEEKQIELNGLDTNQTQLDGILKDRKSL